VAKAKKAAAAGALTFPQLLGQVCQFSYNELQLSTMKGALENL